MRLSLPGWCAPAREAFAQVLTARSRYYVGHYAMDPVTAVRLVREAGGVPVFAHPVASARGRIVGEETYKEMIEAGLLGLEIDHRDNPEEGRKYLRALAERHNLIVTGSSDYHGTGKTNLLGENTTAPEMLRRILAAGTGSRAVGIPDLLLGSGAESVLGTRGRLHFQNKTAPNPSRECGTWLGAVVCQAAPGFRGARPAGLRAGWHRGCARSSPRWTAGSHPRRQIAGRSPRPRPRWCRSPRRSPAPSRPGVNLR